MLLAGDGHRVTVFERDADRPPEDPGAAWDAWPRRGVAQFRQLFYLLPRFRELAERELPAVIAALEGVALRHHPMADVTATPDERDAGLVALTGRRPIVEAAVATVAEASARIDVPVGL